MSGPRPPGRQIAFHDPFVEVVTVDGRELARTELTARVVAGADLVALLTPHRSYDLDWLAATAGLLFDARKRVRPRRPSQPHPAVRPHGLHLRRRGVCQQRPVADHAVMSGEGLAAGTLFGLRS
jgi:hypothetical protein